MEKTIPNLVSTIIPVFNRPELLVEAVESVLKQTHRPIEIIISNDGSTDNVSYVADDLVKKHPNIIKVVNNPNQGAGLAREAGRQLASGEFIQYLDSDDFLHPNKFRDQIKSLKNNTDCGIAFGITRLTDMNGQVLSNPYKWTGTDTKYLFPRLLIDRWWCTHTPLYRREVCDSIGSWTSLKYSQDWEYDSRIGSLGVKLVNCQTIVSDHRHHNGFRQTGEGNWLDPESQLLFFKSLHSAALKGGVSLESKEMAHFSRWVFFQSRECASVGNFNIANQLLQLAIESTVRPDITLGLIAFLTKSIGWRLTSWLFVLRELLTPGKTGKNTMNLSWMDRSLLKSK